MPLIHLIRKMNNDVYIYLIVNLLAVTLFIAYMTNNFLINIISVAGSFYFSMCATVMAFYFF
ncbi:Uncharacterised protein [Psychrobacter phenylpyruvicus]|uniref:Uncharacterized protein n=1 Tax=Psychrobacter phenylpyruvicus TaxID=29432 RepID=A0A379LPJ0_9GAMM|nr:Uncharacterised protein [Psychrobacter phenylpyruvicus]